LSIEDPTFRINIPEPIPAIFTNQMQTLPFSRPLKTGVAILLLPLLGGPLFAQSTPAWWTAADAAAGVASSGSDTVTETQLYAFALVAISQLNELPGGAGDDLNTLVATFESIPYAGTCANYQIIDTH
jgi:hypothetical protein